MSKSAVGPEEMVQDVMRKKALFPLLARYQYACRECGGPVHIVIRWCGEQRAGDFGILCLFDVDGLGARHALAKGRKVLVQSRRRSGIGRTSDRFALGALTLPQEAEVQLHGGRLALMLVSPAQTSTGFLSARESFIEQFFLFIRRFILIGRKHGSLCSPDSGGKNSMRRSVPRRLCRGKGVMTLEC